MYWLGAIIIAMCRNLVWQAPRDSNEVQIYQSTIKNGITDIYGGLGTTKSGDNKVTLDNTAVTLGNSSMFERLKLDQGAGSLAG